MQLAARAGRERAVELLLEASPELACDVDPEGNSLLHSASDLRFNSTPMFRTELLQRIWELNKAAVHAANKAGWTPLQIAVWRGNFTAIDMLAGAVTVSKLARACDKARIPRKRLRPLLERHCQVLQGVLHRDVLATVYGYLWSTWKEGTGGGEPTPGQPRLQPRVLCFTRMEDN